MTGLDVGLSQGISYKLSKVTLHPQFQWVPEEPSWSLSICDPHWVEQCVSPPVTPVWGSSVLAVDKFYLSRCQD